MLNFALLYFTLLILSSVNTITVHQCKTALLETD